MSEGFNELAPMLVAAIALIAGVFIMRPVAMRRDLSVLQVPAIVLVVVLFIFGSIVTQYAISGLVTAGVDWNWARFGVLAVMGLVSGCSLTIGMQKR